MYVVTGATGNTGTVVAKELLSQGAKVRAIGRRAGRLTSLALLGAEPFVGDMSDKETATRAFTGAQAAYVMIPPDLAIWRMLILGHIRMTLPKQPLPLSRRVR